MSQRGKGTRPDTPAPSAAKLLDLTMPPVLPPLKAPDADRQPPESQDLDVQGNERTFEAPASSPGTGTEKQIPKEEPATLARIEAEAGAIPVIPQDSLPAAAADRAALAIDRIKALMRDRAAMAAELDDMSYASDEKGAPPPSDAAVHPSRLEPGTEAASETEAFDKDIEAAIEADKHWGLRDSHTTPIPLDSGEIWDPEQDGDGNYSSSVDTGAIPLRLRPTPTAPQSPSPDVSDWALPVLGLPPEEENSLREAPQPRRSFGQSGAGTDGTEDFSLDSMPLPAPGQEQPPIAVSQAEASRDTSRPSEPGKKASVSPRPQFGHRRSLVFISPDEDVSPAAAPNALPPSMAQSDQLPEPVVGAGHEVVVAVEDTPLVTHDDAPVHTSAAPGPAPHTGLHFINPEVPPEIRVEHDEATSDIQKRHDEPEPQDVSADRRRATEGESNDSFESTRIADSAPYLASAAGSEAPASDPEDEEAGVASHDTVVLLPEIGGWDVGPNANDGTEDNFMAPNPLRQSTLSLDETLDPWQVLVLRLRDGVPAPQTSPADVMSAIRQDISYRQGAVARPEAESVVTAPSNATSVRAALKAIRGREVLAGLFVGSRNKAIATMVVLLLAVGTTRWLGFWGNGSTVVQLRLTVPGAQTVAVVGDFNNWAPGANAMTRQAGSAIWEARFPLAPGRYRYRFLIDGRTMAVDPTHPDGQEGASIIDVPHAGQPTLHQTPSPTALVSSTVSPEGQ